MTTKLLTSPQFRDDIRISFKELADRDLQMKEWVVTKTNSPCPYWSYLKFCVLDTIYNMHDLDEKSYEYIGEIFYDEEEAEAVYEFCKWFDELTDDIGWSRSDSEYLEHPEWAKVWEGAKKIYDIMEANDKKYDIKASWDLWHKQG